MNLKESLQDINEKASKLQKDKDDLIKSIALQRLDSIVDEIVEKLKIIAEKHTHTEFRFDEPSDEYVLVREITLRLVNYGLNASSFHWSHDNLMGYITNVFKNYQPKDKNDFSKHQYLYITWKE